MTREVDLIVKGGAVVTMGERRTILRDGAIVVDRGAILAVEKRAKAFESFAARKVLGGPDKVVFPGLIDCHNHPIHYLSKGMIDDMRFPERWRDRVWPYEAGLSAEEIYLASVGTFLEMIRHGTTCVSDPGTLHPESVARAIETTGMRGVIARLTWDVHDPTAPAQYNDDTETAFRRSEELVKQFHNTVGGRLRAWYSLVRAANVTPELVRRVKAAADEAGVGIHAHLSTTQSEFADSKARWGLTPVERYHSFGVLGPNTQLVHMGALSDADVSILKDYDVTVCHCPSASMFGGFGCVSHGKFPELVASGVRVVLGTDACAVSRFLDMVRVMYLAACAHKDVKVDPTVMGAHKAFEMATIEGAKALLWDREIGSLEAGKRADIVVADTDGLEWQPRPLENPVANLVYSSSGSSVRDVVIDGRIVMEDRQFPGLSLPAFAERVDKASAAIFDRMGVSLRTVWPSL